MPAFELVNWTGMPLVILFHRDRPYEPVGNWAHFVASLCLLVIAGQAALVLLAIRRRFPR